MKLLINFLGSKLLIVLYEFRYLVIYMFARTFLIFNFTCLLIAFSSASYI